LRFDLRTVVSIYPRSAPIRTRHLLVFTDAQGRVLWRLRPKNAVCISGRARLAQLAMGTPAAPFTTVALSADTAVVSPSSTTLGSEIAVRQVASVTISGTFVQYSVTFLAAELTGFGAGTPIRRLGLRTTDGTFLYIVPIVDTVPPPGADLTYVSEIDF
jgi:hypothetical protein